MNIEQPETAPVLAAYRCINFSIKYSESRPTLRLHVLRANGEPACGLWGGRGGLGSRQRPDSGRAGAHGCALPAARVPREVAEAVSNLHSHNGCYVQSGGDASTLRGGSSRFRGSRSLPSGYDHAADRDAQAGHCR